MIALAWRNLWRQPRRTLLTLAAIMLAGAVTVFLLALQAGSYATMKRNTLGIFDGFAQVQPPKYLDDPDMRHTIDKPASLVKTIEQIPGIDAVAQRAASYGLLSHDGQSLGALLVGVQPGIEPKVSSIPGALREGHYLEPGDHAEVILGEALARNLKVAAGDKVTLLGTTRDGSVAVDILTVSGLFASGAPGLDRQLAQMPLARFQADFNMPEQANVLVLTGQQLAHVNQALPAVRQLLEGKKLALRDWSELQPGLAAAIDLDASTSLLWYASLIVVVVVLLLNTLLMSVLERTREFGVLLALGMRSGAIGRMLWLELLLLLALGLGAGIALGGGVTAWYAVHGLTLPGTEDMYAQWGLPGELYPQFSAFSLLTGPAAIAICTGLAGLIPYLRVRRLQPVPAMRAA